MVRNDQKTSNRFNWSQEALTKATEAVRSGSHTVRKAAAEYSVPKSTLHRAIKGNVSSGQRGNFVSFYP